MLNKQSATDDQKQSSTDGSKFHESAITLLVGLPQYRDAEESDVYILSGAEDLIAVFQLDGKPFEDKKNAQITQFVVAVPLSKGLMARTLRHGLQEDKYPLVLVTN